MALCPQCKKMELDLRSPEPHPALLLVPGGAVSESVFNCRTANCEAIWKRMRGRVPRGGGSWVRWTLETFNRLGE